MNGIEKILQRIDEDARKEERRILAEADHAAADILDRFQAQAETEKAVLKERNLQAAAQHEERLVSSAQMEARKSELAVRQELIDQAFSLALEKLCSMPEDRYVAVAADLLVRAAPDGQGSAIFSPETREQIGRKAVSLANQKLGSGHISLAEESRPLAGGFILVRGSVEVNCTFETLVRLERAEIASAAAKRLLP